MKKLLALLLCLSLVLALAACGGEPTPTTAPTAAPTTAPTTVPTTAPTEPPITVEDVYNATKDAMLTIEPSSMRLEFSFGVIYEEGEGEEAVTTEINYDMLMDIMLSEDPFGCYNFTSLSMGTEGFSMDIAVEMHIVEEDGKVVTYAEVFDTWTRQESDKTVEEFLASSESEMIDTEQIWNGGEMPADMTLDPFTQNLDGAEVYILRGTTTVSGLSDALTEMGVELTEDTDEIDLPVVYYVDAKNYTILRLEADMQGMMDILADSMSESLLGDKAEATGLEIEISNAIYDLGYGPQEIPALPQEALDQTAVEETPAILPVEGEASDLGNGSFVLPCGSEAVTITCPESWSGEVYDINNIWIYNDDQSLYGDFYYFTGWTEDDFRDQVQMDAKDLKDLDIFISSGDGPAYEGYTTMTVMGEGESYCYAWTPMGDGHLLVILADYTAEPDFEAMLNELLGLVTPYSGEFTEKAVAEDLGDGSFSLPCGSQTAIITCPEGFNGEVYDVDNIWIYNTDGSIYGDYFYLNGWTSEDVMTYWVLNDADTLKSENTFTSLDDGPAIEGYTTQVLKGDGVSYYYAWTPMGNGCLLLQVYDWDGGDDSAEMIPMLLDAITVE